MTQDNLITIAEKTGFRSSGRTDEVERLCIAFARTWPDLVQIIDYGRSSEGRRMLALKVSRATGGAQNTGKLPLLMLQGGIHPGETDGKDAGFIALRELLNGTVAKGFLDKMSLLFVPAFNVDGHERFGPWNRPNQDGPEEMGRRCTAQNLNLNRDYTKADAPEMRAMLRLIDEQDPLVCADLHVTDGANFEPDISIQVEPINQGAPGMFASGVKLRDELIARLAAQGSLPLPFYPDLATTDDPESGFQLTVYSPRFSTGYYAARNRFTVLVETHSWKDYPTRVRVTRNTIVGLVELVAAHGAKWLEEAQAADAAELAGTQVVLDYAAAWREPANAGTAVSERQDSGQMIDFRGYAYKRELSPISGGLATVYDSTTPQIWRVPLRLDVEPSLTVTAPAEYLVPPSVAADIGARLTAHGIRFERNERPLRSAVVEAFRASETIFAREPVEGRFRLTLKGEWREETRDIAAGSLTVPVNQPLARLVLALFEPQAPDSFAAWGLFNGFFEQKEHIEPYVAEQIAREMLEREPELGVEFKRKVAEDPVFAKDTVARLEYFLRRHESWDERYNLYPVFRVI